MKSYKIIKHSISNPTLRCRPGPLGDPQSYYSGAAKSLCDRIMFFTLTLWTHPYSEWNISQKIADLQAHNASPRT